MITPTSRIARSLLLATLSALLVTACGGGGGGGGSNSGGSSGGGGSVGSAPGTPTGLTIAAGNGTLTVSFTAPGSIGSSAILDYTVSCTGGGATRSATGNASPITVTGLNNGTTYSCSVTARNAVGSSAASGAVTGAPVNTTPTACSVTDRQNWVVAQMNEWYLYPETLPSNINVNNYPTVDALISALTATARAQNKDRNFTYITSAAEEDAFFNSGSSAGFGIRLGYDLNARRLFILESFENAPALAANIDRGDEITAIGTSSSNLRLVSDILAAEGTQGITNALGPSTAGVSRVLRVVRSGTAREVTVAKADYNLEAVSSRYGGRIITDAGKRYGYINLRTFISTADNRLREEIQKFKDAGINEIIIDFRYNGGGLVSTGNLMGDLLGGNRQTSEIFSQLTFRSSKSSNDSIKRFAPQSQSVSPVKLAFITTGSSASASELVVNGFIPYYNDKLALIGSNTFGKPVGQIARDNAPCDDRLRIVAFTTRNSANSDAYFNGLAEAVKASCRANDDFTQPLGSASEASTRQALDWLQGKSCTAIPVTAAQAAAASGIGAQSQISEQLALEIEPLPLPNNPTPAQREVPGLF
ncbi:MAG: fibronectin type III domain-containing protein [Gammaproteobacteria bacterium]|nr:fibronectin type III domain-containing protein [Gammaproteobacteria bacterium]